MHLTLKQKRETVERFKAGESIFEIALDLWGAGEFISVGDNEYFEDAIRDYMNGKFKMSPAREKRGKR